MARERGNLFDALFIQEERSRGYLWEIQLGKVHFYTGNFSLGDKLAKGYFKFQKCSNNI